MNKYRYGWKKDIPDFRDREYMALSISLDQLPAHVDLRNPNIPILDQGQLGSCTANAIAIAHQYEQAKQQEKNIFTPSRLFIYYNERSMEGSVNEDSGAMIRDGIKSVVKQGVCPETEWPYKIEKFRQKPPDPCYKDAMNNQVLSYSSIAQSMYLMKCCLFSGFPFVFGFSVYESFESAAVAKTGIVPMPSKKESLLGGHAVLAEGYDDKTKMVTVRNSWSDKWGDHGYFYLPYDYITSMKLASDFWKISLVEP